MPLISPEVRNSLVKKYPRFCQNLLSTINLASLDLQMRSNLWMIKFIEDCYNHAFTSISVEAGSKKGKRLGNISLGSLDSFPLVAERLVSQTYRYFFLYQGVFNVQCFGCKS